MAWIIGGIGEAELKRLRAAGWRDDDPPAAMLCRDEIRGDTEHRTRAFFVDSDVFEIMTGRDWEPVPAADGEDDAGERE